MQLRCPKCGSVIYSRRNVLCGVCEERLPDQLLFTAAERDVVERDLADARRRARESGLSGGGDSGFDGGDAGGDCGGSGDGCGD